jgi:hypothetical protein
VAGRYGRNNHDQLIPKGASARVSKVATCAVAASLLAIGGLEQTGQGRRWISFSVSWSLRTEDPADGRLHRAAPPMDVNPEHHRDSPPTAGSSTGTRGRSGASDRRLVERIRRSPSTSSLALVMAPPTPAPRSSGPGRRRRRLHRKFRYRVPAPALGALLDAQPVRLGCARWADQFPGGAARIATWVSDQVSRSWTRRISGQPHTPSAAATSRTIAPVRQYVVNIASSSTKTRTSGAAGDGVWLLAWPQRVAALAAIVWTGMALSGGERQRQVCVSGALRRSGSGTSPGPPDRRGSDRRSRCPTQPPGCSRRSPPRAGGSAPAPSDER